MGRFGETCGVGSVLLSLMMVAACGGDGPDNGSAFGTSYAPVGPGVGTAPAEDDEDEDSEGGKADDAEGDESSSTGDADDDRSDDGSSSSGGPDDDTMTTAPATTTTGDSSGDPVLDACLDMATTECESCGCNNCLDPLLACEQDPGCVAIRICGQNSGCDDELSCYEACQAVIDQHGGVFGNSVELAGAVVECVEPMCPVCFP